MATSTTFPRYVPSSESSGGISSTCTTTSTNNNHSSSKGIMTPPSSQQSTCGGGFFPGDGDPLSTTMSSSFSWEIGVGDNSTRSANKQQTNPVTVCRSTSNNTSHHPVCGGSFSSGGSLLLSPKSTASSGLGSGVLNSAIKSPSLQPQQNPLTSTSTTTTTKNVEFDDSIITYASPPSRSSVAGSSRGGGGGGNASTSSSILINPLLHGTAKKNIKTVPKTSNARRKDERYFVEICLLTFLLTLFSLMLMTVLLVFVVPPSPPSNEATPSSLINPVLLSRGGQSSASSSYWHQLLSENYHLVLLFLTLGMCTVIFLGYRIREARRIQRQHLSEYVSKTSKLLSTADMIETASSPASATSSRRTRDGVRSRRSQGGPVTSSSSFGNGSMVRIGNSGGNTTVTETHGSQQHQNQEHMGLRVTEGVATSEAVPKKS